ncbi:5647_t:CDS:2 [Ambispora gerdemannii]|uniref:5647_t:CDS:1 n=1 Tax=Ambispora gerdemannii TaxID=144530 RepID=A0A9N9CJ27_9GLOM|nr:5647_t:CDS:2 [Ambispora gerdemannii]
MPSTNQTLLFSLIFCLYLTSAISQISNTTISNSTSSLSDTGCADYFGVSKCSTCQKTAYGASDDSISNCFALSNETLNGTVESVSTLLRSKCGLTCNQTAIMTLNENIQRDCQQELTEWAKQPDSINITKYILPDLWFSVYSAIPNRKALCSQDSNGSYCAANVSSKVIDYVSSLLSYGEDSYFYVELSPPDGLVSFITSSNSPIKTVSLPTHITCSNCYTALAKSWIDFFNMNPSSIPAVQSALDEYIKPIKGNLTQCPPPTSSNSACGYSM